MEQNITVLLDCAMTGFPGQCLSSENGRGDGRGMGGERRGRVIICHFLYILFSLSQFWCKMFRLSYVNIQHTVRTI